MSSKYSAPAATGWPSHRAVATRNEWPCATSTTSPWASRRRAFASTRSRRAPTFLGRSPPGQPSRHRSQSGSVVRISSRGDALVVAVTPLGQVVVDVGDRQPGEFGRAGRPDPRARDHHGEGPAGQRRFQLGRLFLALGRERQLGHGGMPTVVLHSVWPCRITTISAMLAILPCTRRSRSRTARSQGRV